MSEKDVIRIPSAGPSITQAEIDLVSQAIKDGWGPKMSYYIDEFTEEFSNYIGYKYCLPTSHCTDAIHLAMLTLNLKPDDEVIVPDMTWVASAAPVIYVGAKPVLVDVDSNSWCITAKEIEKSITKKTKAVVVVDLLGNMPEWDEIIKICKKNDLFIIEDASEGIGARYKGKLAGTFGDISLFSFNATKLIMSGQGGMLCTNNQELYKSAKLMSHHGMDKPQDGNGKYYWSDVLGYNYGWTNIQAALALAQLRRINELLDYKKWLFNKYREGLASVPNLKLSPSTPNVDHTYWITTAILKGYGIKKEDFKVMLDKHNIDMRPLFYPLSDMPPFKNYVKGNMRETNPVTYDLSDFGICLPNGNNLSNENVEYICHHFKKALGVS